jgi:hypothetical protein
VRPRSASTGGAIPRARSRSSAIADPASARRAHQLGDVGPVGQLLPASPISTTTEAVDSVLREPRDDAERAHRGRDRGDAEHDRDQRGDHGAERDEQDQQRDRQRDVLGPLEVLGDELLDRVVERAPAGLLQLHAAVLACDRRDGIAHRLGPLGRLVGVAAQPGLNQHDPPAGGGQLCGVLPALD